ncbi:hypothetical protein ANCCEY_02690 [Ancylostoma ceylanicum]|uniref:Uncharacterized protein n=1 Tax=Ancylostoma ceylanicum TaxID=53326 RepID=A0A0D6MC19_9BILA|nr:hypothetical protein ANCCEY_02690 [Ancylostoma ceylanicum]
MRYNVIGDYPRPGSGGEYDVQLENITVTLYGEKEEKLPL